MQREEGGGNGESCSSYIYDDDEMTTRLRNQKLVIVRSRRKVCFVFMLRMNKYRMSKDSY